MDDDHPDDDRDARARRARRAQQAYEATLATIYTARSWKRLPGPYRVPKQSGFDWVMERLNHDRSCTTGREILPSGLWVYQQERIPSSLQRSYVPHSKVPSSVWWTSGKVRGFQSCTLLSSEHSGEVVWSTEGEMENSKRYSGLPGAHVDKRDPCMRGPTQFYSVK